MPNLSHIGNSLMSVYLCHPCHRELNDLVFAWLGDPVAPVIELRPTEQKSRGDCLYCGGCYGAHTPDCRTLDDIAIERPDEPLATVHELRPTTTPKDPHV